MKIILCEVNISEGKDLGVIEEVKKTITNVKGVKVIDVNSDKDHNRTVFTYIGEPGIMLECTKKLASKAIELIDMAKHTGSHPRIGAVDVVPFVPIKGVTIEEAIDVARSFGKYMGEQGVAVYYYEDAALKPERVN